MADSRAALAAAPDVVVLALVRCLPCVGVAQLLRACVPVRRAVRAQLPAELALRGAGRGLAELHFAELAWGLEWIPWTLQPASHFAVVSDHEEFAELLAALSQDMVLTKGFRGIAEGLRLLEQYAPDRRKVRHLGDLEEAALPTTLVFAGRFACVGAEDYAAAWSVDAEQQRQALKRISSMVGSIPDMLEDYALWECEFVSEVAASGLLKRAGALLSQPELQLDALRVLRLVVLDLKLSAPRHRECARILTKHVPVLLQCLASADLALQTCAVDVVVHTGSWLEGLRCDAGLAAELFTAILAFLLRLERQTQGSTLAGERPRSRALSVPIQGLLMLCGGPREVRPALPDRLARGCRVALAAKLGQLLPEAQDVPHFFPELSLAAVCHLLSCLLAGEEGCSIAAATPGLCAAMIGALAHCVHPHDRLCTTSPCRPLLQMAQRERGVLLQCGALPAIFDIVANWWWRRPECLERLIDVLHTPRMLVGATAFARQRFNPSVESGFLPLLPGDEVKVLSQEGLWAWGRKTSSPPSCGGGWFPEALVDTLVERAGGAASGW